MDIKMYKILHWDQSFQEKVTIQLIILILQMFLNVFRKNDQFLIFKQIPLNPPTPLAAKGR